ncbi:MAG: NADH:ubiquinone reductase (Na(+)-transporting) subunit C [Myxococcota bacterium]|nr:NADH:ubiquinone reductase (Na(+)-transporting) subunit C [Myxococcales bacterium]
MADEADREQRGWRLLRGLPPESDRRAVVVTLMVCIACSAAIATAVTFLGPLRDANRAAEREAKLRHMIASVPGLEELVEPDGGIRIEARVVDLATGEPLPDIDPETFDAVAEAQDPERSIALAPEDDVAGLGRRALRARIYLVSDREGLRLVLLPVEGQGYISRLRGYLALDADGTTVHGLSFYEHAETPGLGAEIESPAWRAKWRGKQVYDASGAVGIAVARGRVDPTDPHAAQLVDGITGATRTTEGVTRLLRFWLGPQGFGPTLARLVGDREARPAPEAGKEDGA